MARSSVQAQADIASQLKYHNGRIKLQMLCWLIVDVHAHVLITDGTYHSPGFVCAQTIVLQDILVAPGSGHQLIAGCDGLLTIACTLIQC